MLYGSGMEADKPLECSACKKPITIFYTEVVGDTKTCLGMCSDCPILKHKLYGYDSEEPAEGLSSTEDTTLCCGVCGTSIEDVLMGHPLGCAECYTIFDDVITKGVEVDNHAPKRVDISTKNVSTHIGRAPGEMVEVSPSLRLGILSETLKETLSREDYEQAAWIRDQIKKIEGGKSNV